VGRYLHRPIRLEISRLRNYINNKKASKLNLVLRLLICIKL
jgi:hypothetical protein